ncbi:hypothetical protein [Pseudomonas fragi]|uniref:hypothetical protein n=1 Tax=Pseudomonas fragi TaxID=296 RepID=UPI0029542312|nr:hypothetical protein [Pseudomonas fragi]WOL28630.1 hypothetical protein Q1A94_03075 [Pseudomonas fragi]
MSISKLGRAYLSNASAFIPVIVFLLYGRFGPGEAGVRWDTAYVLSGILSIAHLFWLFNYRPGHWIAMGVDLYLMIGALLASVSTAALQVWGQELGAAHVLACVGLRDQQRGEKGNVQSGVALHPQSHEGSRGRLWHGA